MAGDDSKDIGLRERKRRETLARITETGVSLFLSNGYDSTTLEMVAEAAGISRRTFFYYFKSKEEIILAWQSNFTTLIREAILAQPSDIPPLEVVENALRLLVIGFDPKQSIALDSVLRKNETLRAARNAKYIAQEQAVFEALCEKWPQPKRRNSLRFVAMLSIGAFRLAIDAWSEDNGRRPPLHHLREAFASLRHAL